MARFYDVQLLAAFRFRLDANLGDKHAPFPVDHNFCSDTGASGESLCTARRLAHHGLMGTMSTGRLVTGDMMAV